MVCSKKTSRGKTTDMVDLNTATLSSVQKLIQQRQKKVTSREMTSTNHSQNDAATRQVIAHVFGSQTEQHLLRLQCSNGTTQDNNESASDSSSSKTDKFQFQAQGFISNPAYEPPKSHFELVLFINDRLVQSMTLKRCIESVYVEFTKSKPFVYLSIKVPGHQVDVNVHPTKREVALLFQDDLYEELAAEIRKLLASSGQTFSQTSSLSKLSQSQESVVQTKKRAASNPPPGQATKKKSKDPSRLVRTTKAAPAGALEPFLTPKLDSDTSPDKGQSTPTKSPTDEVTHTPDCEFYNKSATVDMTIPGAFAEAICRCQVKGGQQALQSNNVVIRTRRQVSATRPKRVTPTRCGYKSIQSLRSRITKASHTDLAKQMRNATLVGVVSRRHCLVQCDEQLVLWNYCQMARELFYQLALARFGGPERAMLGNGGVDIKIVLEQALQLEDGQPEQGDGPSLGTGLFSRVSETNSELAQQATACLLDNAEMLEEYFSICIEERQPQNKQDNAVMLTGLPILLNGHAPQPHGLPLFLLRLATEVDWTEERPCFEGVCRELGSYYAEIPFSPESQPATQPSQDEESDDMETDSAFHSENNNKLIDSDADQFVKHSLFPALSFLLVPPKDFQLDGTLSKVALLSSLYKVFERC